MVTVPTATSTFPSAQWWQDLSTSITTDIAYAKAAATEAPVLTGGTDLDTIRNSSIYCVLLPSNTHAHAPDTVSGILRTVFTSSTLSVQTWISATKSGNTYTRVAGSSGWNPWVRTDAGAVDVSSSKVGPPSSFKTVPLALTLGTGGATYASLSRGIRTPVDFAAEIPRFRVHMRNINPRFGLVQAANPVAITGLWIGPQGSAGKWTGTPTQVSSGFTLNAAGDEYVSGWIAYPMTAATSYLLGYGFTATAAATTQVIGGNYYTTAASDAGNNAASTSAVQGVAPLDVWLEAEVPASTAVIAVVGDSLSSGVGATLPVRDSVVSQYCRTLGNAVPIHYAASGDTLSNWTDDAQYKWTRWTGMSAPDAVLMAMGSNDIFLSDNLAQTQADWEAVAAVARKRLTPNLYATTILPRDAVTGSMETTRRSFNAWLKDGTHARDVFDIVPGVSTDDETLVPALQADGIHLTTAGYALNAAAISRPIATQFAQGAQGLTGPKGDPGIAGGSDAATATWISSGASTQAAGDSRWTKTTDVNVVDGSGTVGAKGSIVRLGRYAFNTRATDVNMGLVAGGGVLTENVVGGNPANVNDFATSNLTGAPTLTGQNGLWDFIVSGYDNVVNGWAVVMNGFHNKVLTDGNHATIGGGSLHTIGASAYATVGGGTGSTINAASDGAVIAGGSRHTATGTSTAIGGGSDNVASAAGATVVGGRTNTASGQDSTVLGGITNVASGMTAVASGQGAIADANGMRAHGSRFTVAGDAQDSTVNVKVETTTATQTTLSLHGGGALLIPADTTWAVSALVVARRTDVDGENAAFRIDACIKRDAGSTTALVGTPIVTPLGATAGSTWAATLTTSTPGNINVRVTGEAGKTIRWLANIRIAHVSG